MIILISEHVNISYYVKLTHWLEDRGLINGVDWFWYDVLDGIKFVNEFDALAFKLSFNL